MRFQGAPKYFVLMVIVYAGLCLPGLIWPGYLDSPLGVIVAVPYLSIYLFHGVGIPGLLEHDGACGWGWCSPSLAGWGLLVGFWMLVAWLLACGLARIRRRT